ncbi:outer membrane protein assembly factor BamB family protein [Methanothermobacter thermautotrophicus]
MMRKGLIAALIILGMILSPVSAADWPVFHGDEQHTGYAKEPSDFSAKTWYLSIGGIKSSPAIFNKVAYIGSLDGRLYAVNLETGSVVWSYKTEGAIVSSPVVVNGTVFVGSWDGYLYAIDTDTGDLEWKFKTGNRIESSPAVSGTPSILDLMTAGYTLWTETMAPRSGSSTPGTPLNHHPSL